MIIKDEAIKRLAALHVFEWITKGNVDYLQAAGMSEETIARLKKTDVNDLSQLLQMMYLTVKFDQQRLVEHQQENEYLEYFVKHHATPGMLEKYFRIYGRKESDETYPLNLDDLLLDSVVVRQLLGKHVAYHRILVDVTGSATGALLLSKMIYLQRKAVSSNGQEWFSVTADFYWQELGMLRRQLESARQSLLDKSLIEESLLSDKVRMTRRL